LLALFFNDTIAVYSQIYSLGFMTIFFRAMRLLFYALDFWVIGLLAKNAQNGKSHPLLCGAEPVEMQFPYQFHLGPLSQVHVLFNSIACDWFI